jgi:hypothetical protein
VTLFEEAIHHDHAVRDAAAAVDAARLVHDSAAEALAIAQLEAADRARRQFLEKLSRATRGNIDDHDPARAPGRRFFDGDPR